MSFELFSYQVPLVEAALAAIRRGDPEVLIAGCPGSGKTEMAFEIARRLVESGEIDRALMLTWLRNQLKTQTLDRIKRRAPQLLEHLTVEIPQQRRTIAGKFDLVIQDEAHQAYGVEGGMVEEIKTKVKARTTLLLTGSPSIFIKRGLKPAAVFSLEELHAAGRASDLTIEVGTSSYDILEKDFNAAGDVVQSVRYTQRQTNETFDNLLDGLFKRLKLGRHSMGWWNRTMLKAAKKGWNPILKALKKTIIACRDIKQAEQVAHYFRSQKVRTLVSHSKEDEESENIEAFKTSDIPLLVVVDRAQLGYDNADLVNFIDMTGSRNPDRIFQMLCRVVRPSETIQKKLFIKVMPASFSDQNLLFFMEGVLNLSRREIFETYDGTGFYKQTVPGRTREPSSRTSGRSGPEVKGGEGIKEPVLEPGMGLFGTDGPAGYFEIISHTNHDGYEAIGQVRLGDVVGRVVIDTDRRKQEVVDYFVANGRWPIGSSADPIERRLGGALSQYARPTLPQYDPEFERRVRALGWLSGAEKAQLAKTAVVEFFKRHGRWPNSGSKDPSEAALGSALSRHTSGGRDTYDPKFKILVESLGWVSPNDRLRARKEAIVDFFHRTGAWPNKDCKGEDELSRRLGNSFLQYVHPRPGSSGSYDPEFERRVRELGWRPVSERTSDKKSAVVEFFRTNGTWPNQKSSSKNERGLASSLSQWANPSAKRYDREFEGAVRALGWMPSTEVPAAIKSEIIAFFQKEGHWPRQGARHPESERRLSGSLCKYLSGSHKSYDPKFEAQVRELGWLPMEEKSAIRKQQILDFWKASGRWPSYAPNRPEEERRLGQSLSMYILPTSKTFDLEFTTRLEQLGKVRTPRGSKITPITAKRAPKRRQISMKKAA